MTEQVIYDRGYRTYDGPRRGPSGARRAVYRDGLRRVLGLGRKGRYKVFPWSLIVVALVAAVVFVGLHWAVGNLAESIGQGLPAYGELFDFYSAISLLFIAFAGPALLIPDRTKGVLSIYFSRPLTVDSYLTAKVGAFATVIGGIYLVPQILLHLGLGLIAEEGFFAYIADNVDVLWRVPLTAAGFVTLHGALVFILGSLISRPGMAAAAFLGLITAAGGVASRVAEAEFAGARFISLLALDQHPRIIRDRMFNDTVTYPAEAAGFDVWASVAVIVVAALAAVVFVRARYRRLA